MPKANPWWLSAASKPSHPRCDAIKQALKERMSGMQGQRAREGYRRWLESGGRELIAKSTALRHWKRNPLWIHFGIIPVHLR